MRKSAKVGIAGAAVVGGLIVIGAVTGGTDAEGLPAPRVTVTEAAQPAPEVTVTAKPEPAKTVEKTVEPAAEESFTDGTYLVGEDIKAGTYKTKGPGSTDILDSCYMERASDDSGELESILDNENLTGSGRTTLSNGQVFTVSGGCEWSRVK